MIKEIFFHASFFFQLTTHGTFTLKSAFVSPFISLYGPQTKSLIRHTLLSSSPIRHSFLHSPHICREKDSVIFLLVYLWIMFENHFCYIKRWFPFSYRSMPILPDNVPIIPGFPRARNPVLQWACKEAQSQEWKEEEDLGKNEKNKKKLFYREAIGAAGLLLILAADIFTKLHFVVLFSMAAWILLELWIIYDYRKNRQQVSIEIVDTETLKKRYENTEIRTYRGAGKEGENE